MKGTDRKETDGKDTDVKEIDGKETAKITDRKKSGVKKSGVQKLLTVGLLAVSAVLFLFLSAYSFLYTHYSLDGGYDTYFVVERDSILLHLAALAVFGLLCAGACRLVLGKPEKARLRLRLLLGGVMAVSLAVCVGWIAFGHFIPQGDQYWVLENLRLVQEGNYEVLGPAGGYGAYRNQIPMGTLFALLFRLAGSSSHQVIQYTNALCVPLLIFAGFRFLGELLEDKKIQVVYCLLMLFCLPLFVYTAFVYGEVISATAGMVFAWLFALYWKKNNYLTWIGMAFCAVIGTMARGNFPVVLIAALILLAIHAFLKRRPLSVILGVLLLALAPASDAVITKYYEGLSGVAIDQGAPVEAWIAMGLNESSPVAYGWYTGYVLEVYKNCGYDREAARRQSLAYIRDRLTMFRNGAGVGIVPFLKQKLLVQWNEPVIECFTVNDTCVPEPAPFVAGMLHPETNKGVREFMNQYQSILYLGVLLFCLTAFWNKKEFGQFLLLTAVIGGFLLSLIWETKTRYTFPYFVYLVPYGAAGWCAFSDRVQKVLASMLSDTKRFSGASEGCRGKT